MKSILIRQIQNILGVVTVEPYHISPEEPNELLCIVTFEPDGIVDRLSPEEVAARNYAATEKRGLINSETKTIDFIDKIKEELDELYLSWQNVLLCPDNLHFDPKELADIVITCENMAIHYGVDLQKEKELKMYVNEKRK